MSSTLRITFYVSRRIGQGHRDLAASITAALAERGVRILATEECDVWFEDHSALELKGEVAVPSAAESSVNVSKPASVGDNPPQSPADPVATLLDNL